MIVVLLLQTYASLLSLLKISLMIRILRPWQSVRNARTETSGKKQLMMILTRLRKKGVYRSDTYTSQNISCWIQMGFSFEREMKIMMW
jgi:hypothetical protein